jgi:Protein of unknown function (DUF4019)
MIDRVTVHSLILATALFIAGCSHTTPQQMAAYSVATGFLTLCDDAASEGQSLKAIGDYTHALDRFARPLKSSPAGATWAKTMTANRAKFGQPVQRAMISRNDYRKSYGQRRTINFEFQTSFVNQPSAQESVSLEMLDARWQVYDYQFHPFGKPVGGTPTPTPHPTRTTSPGTRTERMY